MTVDAERIGGLPTDFTERVKSALDGLFKERSRLTNTTERAVVGRLAIHLERTFADLGEAFEDHPRVWDVEYMRAGVLAKAFQPVDGQPGLPALRARRLAPDLVWHRRLLDHPAPTEAALDANLAVIEVKLAASQSELLTDKAKLRLLCGLEERIERWQKDLRCEGDEPPNGQEQLGWVAMPPPLPDFPLVPPYRLGMSINIYPRRVQVVENRAGHVNEHHWPMDDQ